MESDSLSRLKQKRFDALMQSGREAYDRGDRRLAHDYWREAATLNPHDEQVWLALYRVLSSDDDRVVCLRNIVAINPANAQARERLADLEYVSGPVPSVTRTQPTHVPAPPAEIQPPERRGSAGRALLIGVLAGLAGVAGGILLSILIYGR